MPCLLLVLCWLLPALPLPCPCPALLCLLCLLPPVPACLAVSSLQVIPAVHPQACKVAEGSVAVGKAAGAQGAAQAVHIFHKDPCCEFLKQFAAADPAVISYRRC